VSDSRAKLQAVLEAEVAARGVPGANAEIFADAEPAWRGAAGVRDGERGDALPPGATFPIYSITKTFSAVAALRIAERGDLDLDAPVATWLPELPFAGRVRLRQLLGHTAGVFNYSALPEYHAAVVRSPGVPWSFEEFVAHTCHRPLDFQPGCGWSYSNTGYTLVRRILEAVGGGSFADVVQREVVEPAGLTGTFALVDLDDMQKVVPGHSLLFTDGMRGPPRDVRGVYHPGWCGTGVLASTTGDVCRFFDALLRGLIAPRSVDAMLALTPVPGHHPPAVEPRYGLGIMADPRGACGAEYGHGGGGPGWNLRAILWPALAGRRVTVAVFCNRDDESAEAIARALALEFAASPRAESEPSRRSP